MPIFTPKIMLFFTPKILLFLHQIFKFRKRFFGKQIGVKKAKNWCQKFGVKKFGVKKFGVKQFGVKKLV